MSPGFTPSRMQEENIQEGMDIQARNANETRLRTAIPNLTDVMSKQGETKLSLLIRPVQMQQGCRRKAPNSACVLSKG